MWKPNEVWTAYTKSFEDLENARREWSRQSLDFLNLVSMNVSKTPWAKKSGLNITPISVKDWYQKSNVDHLRRSSNFDLGSEYRFLITIGFGSNLGSKRCDFYTHVDCRLKNGNQLRKRELEAVKQFVESEAKDTVLDPQRPWAFYYAAVDATAEAFCLEFAVVAVKETLEALSKLKDILMATRKLGEVK